MGKIKEFNCLCKNCNTFNCELVSQINTKQRNDYLGCDVDEIRNVNLKNEQLRIIHCLHIEDKLSESLIASELDCSPETARAYLRSDRKLRIDGYIIKNENSNTYSVTQKAEQELYNNGTN
ncbi:MAG: hypothetical protein LBN18_03265 [Dysgonamonadaceae bacterium]|nr:hypothetical protein [Dysgonamonadaceae bacterium]